MDFLFRGRDVVLTMNSIKILHAVRSAITAIAELLVLTNALGSKGSRELKTTEKKSNASLSGKLS